MSCVACDKPAGGLYLLGCAGCTVRLIARGLHRWQSAREKRITPAYAAQLRRAFGAAWQDGHTQVKAEAARLGLR